MADEPTVDAHRSGVDWRACNCATTPPTIPTARANHLPTCPQWFRDYIVQAIKDCEHLRDTEQIAREIASAAAIQARNVLAVWDGIPHMKEADRG